MFPTRYSGRRAVKRLTDSPSGASPCCARTSSTRLRMRVGAELRQARQRAGAEPAEGGVRWAQPETERGRVRSRDQRPHEGRGQRDRDPLGLPQHERSAPTATGRWRSRRAASRASTLLQVGDLVGDRLDQPVAHDRQQPPAAGTRPSVARVDRAHAAEARAPARRARTGTARSPSSSTGPRTASPL